MSETAASENFALKDDMVGGDMTDTSALDRVVAKAPAKAEPQVEIVKDAPIRVKQDRSRDALLTDFGKRTLVDRYLLPDEVYQDMFARVSEHYSDDQAHAQRLYDYMSKLWFMPATPVLSNGGAERGLPISCFLNAVDDSLDSIVDVWNENVWLASNGGGIGTYWGNVRSIGERIGQAGKTSGIIPFIRVMDSLTLAISQGSLRRGSAAVYLDIHHPEFEEFLEIRKPSGDFNRKSLNLHHGLNITDEFMEAVRDGAEFGDAGLKVQQSNLCAEIMLATGKDKYNKQRTAVCCLSSINAEKYDEWKNEEGFIEDIMRFLDNVLEDFIQNAPDKMAEAKYSAMRERSVGLGLSLFRPISTRIRPSQAHLRCAISTLKTCLRKKA
jgi:ribonucleoside-diphosphate reductase alpha chain